VRRAALLAFGVVTLVAAIVAVRSAGRVREVRRRLETASSPSVRLYDVLAGRLLGGLYELMASEAAVAVDGLEQARILEVGPGPGHLAERLATRSVTARMVGLDIDPAMLAVARTRATRAGLADRLELVEGDVAALPFPDGSFDLVVSSFSVHHWPDPAAGFREIGRVLRRHGVVLVYDLPDAWGRFETGAPGLEAAARAGGLASVAVDAVAWPGPVRLVRRLRAGGLGPPAGPTQE
jgi:SAM-dependent methyltransferase